MEVRSQRSFQEVQLNTQALIEKFKHRYGNNINNSQNNKT